MNLELYQIDAFTDVVFGGNPACVVPLKKWLPDETLLKITKENAVAETAFFIDEGDKIQLRWFTPEIEMDLCGHATLATAHCLRSILNYPKDEIIFDTISGELIVSYEDGYYCMDFPSRPPIVSALPQVIKDAFNIKPLEVLKSRDYLLIYNSEKEVRNIKVDRNILDQINLDPGGVVVTAKGKSCDFVSRFFTPQATILEDPVTGSAHCSLIPYWSSRLGKSSLMAMQLSERKGVIKCQYKDDRVLISGKARTYLVGQIWIN